MSVLGSYDYDGGRFNSSAQLLDMRKLRLYPAVQSSGPLANLIDVDRAGLGTAGTNAGASCYDARAVPEGFGSDIRLDAFGYPCAGSCIGP